MNDALSGNAFLVERRFEDLAERIVDGSFPRDKLLRLVERWIDGEGGPRLEDYVKVVSSSRGIAAETRLPAFLSEHFPELVSSWERLGASKRGALLAFRGDAPEGVETRQAKLLSEAFASFSKEEPEEIPGIIETSMDVELRIDLIKGKTIDWPRLEDENYIMVAGSACPLIDAFRLAHVELVMWLEQDYGFDRLDAYELLGQLAESTVANIVDPVYTVVAKFPKRYLPQ